jgi:hypothetical protein
MTGGLGRSKYGGLEETKEETNDSKAGIEG